MIENLPTSLLLTSELAVVAKRITEAVTQALTEEDFIQRLTGIIALDVEQVEAASGRASTSEFTTQIATHDELRDNAFAAMRDLARANSSRSNPQVSEAGEFVYDIFQTRGSSLNRLGYTQQTAALTLLFEDLSTPEAQQSLATIGATAWLEDLQSAQAAFEAAMHDRAATESQREIPPIRVSRSNVSQGLATLLGSIEALRRIEATNTGDTSDNLSNLINTINEIITNVISVARARRTRETSTNTEQPSLATSGA